jgi:hypothetical protein
MVDDSINAANAVVRHYREPSLDEQNDMTRKIFIDTANLGFMEAASPINFRKDATVCDMLEHSLNQKGWGGIQLHHIFAKFIELAKEDDEAAAMLETMADQFVWRTT